MKKNIVKWIKVVLLVIWIAFLLDLTRLSALFVDLDYGTWRTNSSNVQERLYEAITTFFSSVQILILVVALLFFAILRLVRTVMQPKGPGKITELIRQKAPYLAIGFICIFVLLLLPDLAAIVRIRNTVETSEVPAALHDYKLHGKLGIGMELAAIGAIAFLVSWKRGRKEKKHGRAENPSVSSVSK